MMLSSLYLFFLGLAAGIALLTTTAYRHVSPSWLKWLLTATGLFVISRYVAMALFVMLEEPPLPWLLRRCWYATSVGLTLPSVMAIDQLLRHPAMSPRKLLIWFSPFLAVYVSVIVLSVSAFPEEGTPTLAPAWQGLLSITQGLFVVGFIGICVMLILKFRSRPIQAALLGLALAYAYLGIDGLLLATGRWYFRPFLFSEMATLLALWYAYETGAALQRSG